MVLLIMVHKHLVVQVEEVRVENNLLFHKAHQELQIQVVALVENMLLYHITQEEVELLF